MSTEPQSFSVSDERVWKLPYFCIAHVLLTQYKLSSRAFHAYCVLAHVAKGRSSVNVSIKNLASIPGLSEDTIKRALAECEKKKVIRVKKRFKKTSGKRPTQQQLPNEYILLNLKDSGSDPI